MSILYMNIAKAVALRANQLGDAVDAADLDALYAGELIEAMDGMEVPYTALKQQILASEKRIGAFVTRYRNPVLCLPLRGVSANIADKGVIPTTDADDKQWLGAFGSIKDSTTHDQLTEKPIQEIRRLNRLIAVGAMTIPVFHYAMEGGVLHHTRENVYIEGSSWDYGTQATAYDLPPSTPADFTYAEADVDITNNRIAKTAHGYYTGLKLRTIQIATHVLPAATPALTDGGIVYAIYDDANHIKLAASLTNALHNTPIDLTNDGTGNNTIQVVPFAGAGQSPLAQELETFLAADVLANLAREDWFVGEAGTYANIVAMCEEQISQGLIPTATLPDTTATPEPVKN